MEANIFQYEFIVKGLLGAIFRQYNCRTGRNVCRIDMFSLGLSRGESADTLFVTAIALAIAAIPTALPTVLQVILSGGAKELAGESAIVKDLMSVETLGSTSAINSDKTGTLTMNQMTAVELLTRWTATRSRAPVTGSRARCTMPLGPPPPSMTPCSLSSSPATRSWLKARSSATRRRAPCSSWPTRRAWTSKTSRARFPRLATLPFDPTYKLMATFHSATDASGKSVVRCFVKGAAPAVIGRAAARAAGVSVPGMRR